MNPDYDLFIIGGGINGCGIANDASGRGLSVLLCEQRDLASGTSSASTKLIHGGLRYLEQYEFRLVRESLQEREVMLSKAPHLIYPLEFIIPHHASLRPYYLMRLGLFLYDHLSHRQKIPHSKGFRFANHPAGQPLQERFTKGFSYYDCWVDDARLVVTNAISAKNHGANILTQTECLNATRHNNLWQITYLDKTLQVTKTVTARALVNAGGPWANKIEGDVCKTKPSIPLHLIKGSHIVVPKLYQGDFAYLLQLPDKRIVFTIPYLNQFTMIGTTDVIYTGDPHDAKISDEEVDYLITAVSQYLVAPINKQDIIWQFAGVRALASTDENNPSQLSRDYILDITDENGQCPLLNVYGGKITTYRKLAEHAMDKLAKYFDHLLPAWTKSTPLPGGNIENNDYHSYLHAFCDKYPWLDTNLSQRLTRNYGTIAENILANAKSYHDLGIRFSKHLFEREIDYLIENEWAKTTEDILFRRTKLGLFLSENEKNHLNEYLKQKKLQKIEKKR